MNDIFEYEESGEISCKTPLEALRKAIAPVLEKYNFQSHEVKKTQITENDLEKKSNKN